MSTGPAAVFHRQPEPLPESADQVLLASIFERVLSREAGRAAAVDMIATFHGLAGVAAADEAALLRAGLHRGGVAELVRIRDMALAMTRAQACDRPVLSSWTALTAYLRAALAHAPREQFRTLYLDKRNILMCDEWRADGTIDHAPVYNSGPARVASLGRIPRIRETEHYVESVVECFLAMSAGRVVSNARQCRREGPP